MCYLQRKQLYPVTAREPESQPEVSIPELTRMKDSTELIPSCLLLKCNGNITTYTLLLYIL